MKLSFFVLILVISFTISIPSSGGGCGPSGSGSSVVLEVETLKRRHPSKKPSTPPPSSPPKEPTQIPSHFCEFKCLVGCEGNTKAALPIKNCPITPSDLYLLVKGSGKCQNFMCNCLDVIENSGASVEKKAEWRLALRSSNPTICRMFAMESIRDGGPPKVLDVDLEDFYGDF